MKYRKSEEVTLPGGKQLKNFLWRVRRWGIDERNNEAFVEVDHWHTQDQLDLDDVDVRHYTKSGQFRDLAAVETFVKAKTEYTSSVAE